MTVTEIGQNPFVSNLKLEKAKFWETGEYTCKYKDLEVEVRPSKAFKIKKEVFQKLNPFKGQ